MKDEYQPACTLQFRLPTSEHSHNIPCNEEQLSQILHQVLHLPESEQAGNLKLIVNPTYADCLYIRKVRNNIKVNVNDILYLEASKNYTDIHLKTETYSVCMPLHEVHEYLSPDRFLRIHRSYVINKHYVASTTVNTVVLENGKEIKIRSQQYRELVESAFPTLFSRKRITSKKHMI